MPTLSQPEFSVAIDTGDARRLSRALSPATITGPLNSLLTKSIFAGERAAKGAAPQDTGVLKRAISTEVKPFQARIYMRREQEYFRVMEYGRRAGATMPPPNKLRGWAARHGMAGKEFLIARSIARRGIKGRFYMQEGRKAVKSALPLLMAKLGRDITTKYGRTL